MWLKLKMFLGYAILVLLLAFFGSLESEWGSSSYLSLVRGF